MFRKNQNLTSSGSILQPAKSRNVSLPSRYWITVLVAVMIITVGYSSVASAAITRLTGYVQGNGNKGFSFTPVDDRGNQVSFTIMARSSIDHTQPFNANASGELGTVSIDKKNKGAGVQNSHHKGSKGISGGGGDKDEELIFTYDSPVLLDSIVLALDDIEFGKGLNDKDDPVIFLSTAGSGVFGTTITENDIFSLSAFTSTGKKKGEIDFGSFSSLSGATAIVAFKVRETNGHIYVTGVSEGGADSVNPIPAPGACVLGTIGMGFVSWLRRRRAL